MIMISHDSALLYWRIASFGRRVHRAGNRRSVQSLKVPTDEEVKLAWDCCYHPGQFEGRAFNFGSRDSSEELVYKVSGSNGEIESSKNTDRDRDFDEFEGMPCALQAALAELLAEYGDEPLHVLVSPAAAKSTKPGLVMHSLTSMYPSRLCVELGRKVSVVRPELCFVQMAHSLSLYHLIELGFEMCGEYAIGDDAHRIPVMSVSQLGAFLACCKGIRGKEKALRALKYIRDKSASPMETKMAMVLGLPCALGGFGLGMPEMNYEISAGVRNKALNPLGKNSYRCDLFWKRGNVSVEYDSDLWHTGPKRIAADAKRRSDLDLLGVKVITVTNGQTKSRFALRAIALLVARYCGRKVRPRVKDHWRRQTKLFAALGL